MERHDTLYTSSRRRFLRGAAAATAGTLLAGSSGLLSEIVLGQNPPSCPAALTGGTSFVPGSDTRPLVMRLPISALPTSQLAQLQAAFTALRALPSSDARTWVLQADIHSLFCDQCSGVNMQIHDSWNFFPWHRAYLYYYERILGSLVGDMDHFRLPYWNWETNRSMPSSYLMPATSGNSLYDANRDSGIAGGGPLPATDGTASRITTLLSITDFATFGGAAASGGACEVDPHNIIHTDVGPNTPSGDDMGNLGYAARDPIFFGHHCNIDKIWSKWNSLGGGGTAYKNPTDSAFLTARWSFYDENSNVVSISAADVLDHKDNLRYIYQGPTRKLPFPLYEILACEVVCCLPGPDPGPFLKVSQQVSEQVLTQSRAGRSVLLVLNRAEIPTGVVGTFDVISVRGERRTRIGALSVVANTMADKSHKPVTLVLDISKAAQDLLATEKPASIVLSARNAALSKTKPFVLKAASAQIRLERSTQKGPA